MDIEILEKKRVRGKKEDSYWKHRNPLKSMTLVHSPPYTQPWHPI